MCETFATFVTHLHENLGRLCAYERLCSNIRFMLLNFWGIAVSGGEHVDVIIGAAVADGKVTPKVQSLIKILLKYQHTDDFRAIIFVERVVAALVLPKVGNVYAYIFSRALFIPATSSLT